MHNGKCKTDSIGIRIFDLEPERSAPAWQTMAFL